MFSVTFCELRAFQHLLWLILRHCQQRLSLVFKLNIDDIFAHYPLFVCKLQHKSASDLVIKKNVTRF